MIDNHFNEWNNDITMKCVLKCLLTFQWKT